MSAIYCTIGITRGIPQVGDTEKEGEREKRNPLNVLSRLRVSTGVQKVGIFMLFPFTQGF